MNGHTLWSFTPSRCSAKPAVVQLQNVSQHGPLHSVAASVPLYTPSWHQRQQLDHVCQISTTDRHLPLAELLQQHIRQQPRTHVTWKLEGRTACRDVQQQREVVPTAVATGSHLGLHYAALPQHLIEQQGVEVVTDEQWQLPQWHVVKCCATPVLLNQVLGTSSQSKLQQQATAPTPPLRQPPALHTLAAAAKNKQPVDPELAQQLLSDLQPLLQQLVPEHLAHAAWAAAQLAEQCPPSKAWLAALMDAAAMCFQPADKQAAGQREASSDISNYDGGFSNSNSSNNLGISDAWNYSRVMDPASIATILQACVKLQQQPGDAWLSACCESMAVEHWTCPRALSTVAACLPQLAYVPSLSWRQQFFAASAASLPTFPAISLARMLHGVVAWQHVKQQRQQQDQAGNVSDCGNDTPLLPIPEQWLIGVCHGLVTQSSKLKAAELAMVLQSMQRLQQVPELLLPSAGRQPRTPLQQAGQQLLHASMAAVGQQLEHFKAKDLTVMLLAVASLHSQQEEAQQLGREAGAWWWLQGVLRHLEVYLSKLDARGQAACLAAAALLVKPYLQQQQQQQQAAMLCQPLQQQQHRRQSSAADGSSQPLLVKPLQRWLQHQQHLVATAEVSSPSATGTDDRAQQAAPPAVSTATETLEVSAVDCVGQWQSLLVSFYRATSEQLSAFSPTDVTVAVCSLASMQEVPPVAWYEQLLNAIQQQLPAMSSGQVSGVAWGLGRMAMLPCQHNAAVSLVPSAAWMQRLYPLVSTTAAAAATEQSAEQRNTLREQSAAASNIVRHQHHPTAASADSEAATVAGGAGCTYSLCDSSPAEVVRLMWAAAVCDFDPGDTWWAAAEQQIMAAAAAAAVAAAQTSASLDSWPGGCMNGCSSGSGNSGAAACTSSTFVTLASSFSKQQLPVHMLGMLLQSYAAAGRPVPPSMLQQLAYSSTVMQQLLQVPVGTILQLLRGLKQAGCQVPQGWLQQLAVQLQPQLKLCKPCELPQLLGCLADAGLNLQQQQQQQQETADRNAGGADSSRESSSGFSSSCFRAACLEAGLAQLYRMSVQDASLLLWSCAKLQLKPPAAWLETVLQAMQASFINAEIQPLALALTACCKLGYLPSSTWLVDFTMATHRKVAAMAASPVSNKLLLVRVVLQLLWGLAGLGAAPNHKWMKLLLLSLHQQLPLLTPRHVASLLLVLARLKVKPSPVFLQSLVDSLGGFGSCSNAELVKLVYAAAMLRWVPNKRCCHLLSAATAGRLDSLNPVGLAVVQWALAVMRITPSEPWKSAAIEAVMACVDDFDAQCLAMVVWAWGRQMVHLVRKPWEDTTAAQQQVQPHQLQQSQVHLQQQEMHRQLKLLLQRREKLEQQQQQLQSRQSVQGAALEPAVQSSSSSSKDSLSSKRRQLFERRAGVAEAVLAAALRLRGTYSNSSLVHLLVGVAKMRLTPGQAWLQDMVLHGSTEKLSVLNGYELQQLVWALARLGYRAQGAWLDNVAVLLEVRVTQQQDSTRHSAAWAMERLRQVAVAPAVPAEQQ